MIPTSRWSALRNASGMKPSASTASVISSSGEATCGATTVLASGTKMSAAPKPEKPRAVAAMNAVTSSVASACVERREEGRFGNFPHAVRARDRSGRRVNCANDIA